MVYLDLYRLKPKADTVWARLADAVVGSTDASEAPDRRAAMACTGRRLLVVLEGAELADGSDGNATLPGLLAVLSPENHVLVLTREHRQAVPAQALHIDQPLAPDEAEALFDRLARKPLPADVRRDVLELLQGHPLALTWAASLVADDAENPKDLLALWRKAELPPLSDPTRPERTLGWLFERSTQRLDRDSVALLAGMAWLAYAPVPLTAAIAALEPGAELEGRARSALSRLVHRSLLRRPDRSAEFWQFTHVLGHGFARGLQPNLPLPDVGDRLKAWLESTLKQTLADPDPPVGELSRTLAHAAALLPRLGAERGLSLMVLLQYDAVDLLRTRGRLGDALVALKSAQSFHQGVATAAEATLDREQAVWHGQVGNLQLLFGRLEAAAASQNDALALSRRLAQADPSNTQWQRDVGVALDNVGRIREAQGQLEAALQVYDESLALRRRLAQADPSNTQWQRDLSVSMTKTAEVLAELGRTAEACALARESLAIDERLVALAPEHATWQQDVEVSRRLVARLCDPPDPATQP